MTNRYYLVDLVASPNATGRLQRQYNRLARKGGIRERPHQIGHGRVSLDGTLAIVQGECDDAEHSSILADKATVFDGAYDPVTGLAPQSVYDYLAANRAAWEGETAP